MPIDNSRLRQILELEKKQGYNDKAVFGGLDKFLSLWWVQTAGQITLPAKLKQIRKLLPPAFSYSDATPADRADWAGNLFELLNEQSSAKKTVTKQAPSSMSVSPTRRSNPTKTMMTTSDASLELPISSIKGIAVALSTRFAKIGVRSIRDLLYYFPNRHLDYSRLLPISGLSENKEQTIIANVWEVRVMVLHGKRHSEAILGDETGNVRAIWFNNPFVTRQMKNGDRVVMSGRVRIFAGRPVFESPEWEIYEEGTLIHTGRMVPMYPLTSGLHQRQVRKLIKNIVDTYAEQQSEFIPQNILSKRNLMTLSEAISQAHFPHDWAHKEQARQRLAFNELLLLQIGVMAKKRKWQKEQPSLPLRIETGIYEKLIASLPFALTGAQKQAIGEIYADISKPIAMSRLLQGEVGSGKTIVALAALLMGVANNCQGALMAPTEILATQHFQSVSKLLSNLGQQIEQSDSFCSFSGIMEKSIGVALLISDNKGATKKELKKALSDAKIDIIIGTHALIQKEVSFAKLGLVVIDEQHRFGVEQRSALRQKGYNPHMLVMTATPIPRTLALTIYGDLDLSVLDELPPGRQAIKTKWFSQAQRESAYRFLRKAVSSGRQAFIICPLVEESDAVQAKAAMAEYQRLSQQVFPDLRLSLLHGRMSATEKENVMQTFNKHESDILVSTPVVEVGIDVPNATVMMIESADRFGLSQLHQFRGRVGRGVHQSYCMLMSDNPSLIGRQRLDIIETTQDGFKLADEDLKLRGPGEFFGTRQSGLPDLRMAKLSDISLLEMARNEATLLFESDPDLKTSEHQKLALEMARVWGNKSGEWS
ncbi:MAG: ATP-dependent DNA helicase RecG [Dehalococcoidia bacterium]|nr:ATP-dependent DNA helicase RecG [Dehalococcoidia bacterium]